MRQFHILAVLLGLFCTQSHAVLLDDSGDRVAHAMMDQKINELYKKAKSCRPVEFDSVSNISVDDFMELKPNYPGWQEIEKLEATARKAASYAEKKSLIDKVRHCFAGCYVRKKLDSKSGVLVAFLKEMQDASDCKSSTHFELEDYRATEAGVRAGGKTTCNAFCGSDETASMTGSQMLRTAKRLKKK